MDEVNVINEVILPKINLCTASREERDRYFSEVAQQFINLINNFEARAKVPRGKIKIMLPLSQFERLKFVESSYAATSLYRLLIVNQGISEISHWADPFPMSFVYGNERLEGVGLILDRRFQCDIFTFVKDDAALPEVAEYIRFVNGF